jgi:hypothetical protein
MCWMHFFISVGYIGCFAFMLLPIAVRKQEKTGKGLPAACRPEETMPPFPCMPARRAYPSNERFFGLVCRRHTSSHALTVAVQAAA